VTQAYDKLNDLLKELFQFDREDLDFGIYRILNHKREEVVRFLNKDLLPQVQQAFSEYRAGDESQKRERMEEIEREAATFNADPEQNEEFRLLSLIGSHHTIGDTDFATLKSEEGLLITSTTYFLHGAGADTR
jgi:adenine-specific DNA-methyltransferase